MKEIKDFIECIILVIMGVLFGSVIVLAVSQMLPFDPTQSAQNVRRFQAASHGNKTYGTGFNLIHGGKSYVITNQHVCAVSKRLGHPKTAIVNGRVLDIIKVSKNHDLCALQGDSSHGFFLAFEDVKPLDEITLMGHPRGLDLIIRDGAIVTEDEEVCIGGYEDGMRCRKSDRISALAYGGNSGSAVLNSNGRVIGVLYAGADAYPHEPFIVPYEFLRRFVNSL